MPTDAATLAVAAGVLAVAVGWWVFRARIAISSIEYLGEQFPLRRTYLSYDSYRNDPQNLRPEHIGRIETLLTSQKIGPGFKDEADFGKQAGALKFPGYGMAGLPVEPADKGFMLVAIEVPGTKKYRYLLAGKSPSGLQVADDFVLADQRISRAAWKNGVMSYYTVTQAVREHKL